MIVVDTNISCLRWLPTGETSRADALLQRDPHWSTSMLWWWEFRNALADYIRRGSLAGGAATAICAKAEATMAENEFLAPTAAIFDLVAHSSCTACDCEFVAVARERGLRLITGDREILREFPHLAISLEDFLSQ